jgi:DNA-binding ferritin-like protein
MTPKQFQEQKKMLEAIQEEISNLSKNLVTTFNVVNKTSHYVGADNSTSSDSDMLKKILAAVTK